MMPRSPAHVQVTEVQGTRHAQEKSNAALQDCMHALHEKQVELTRLQASNCSANLLRQDIIAAETKVSSFSAVDKDALMCGQLCG